MRIFRDKDARLKYLQDKTIAILGYGSLGRAQALNLRDSGQKVIIGLPARSKSREIARKDGFRVGTVAEAAGKADILSLLFPDHLHQEVFQKEILPNLRPGQALIFAAGFSIHFKLVKPPKYIDVILVAPHSPGITTRELFLQGRGVPAFLAVAKNYSGRARHVGLAYAKAIGCTRALVAQTTFEHEALGDLFGEQVVLCGGLSELVLAGFETLVKNGLPPENAYLETLHQLDLLSRLLKEKGVGGFYREISLLAAYGSYKNGAGLIDAKMRRKMERIFERIRSGKFTREFLRDYQKGLGGFNGFLARRKNLLLDRTAAKFRNFSGS